MFNRLLVHFVTTGPRADERLVREYVLDAVDRLPGRPDCDRVGFVRAGHKPIDGGLVLLLVEGDGDAVVERERDRWDALVEGGLAEEWGAEEADHDYMARWGEDGAALRTRLEALAARMSRLAYEEFDDPPDPVDEFAGEAADRESPTGLGWWTLLHLLTVQQGYSYGMEIDAYVEGIREAALKTAHYRDRESAIAKLDEAVAALDDVRDEIERVAEDD
jgi:hypothetical protein